VIYTLPNGTQKEFTLSIDAIVEEEERDPDYSFFSDLSSLGDKIRFGTIKRLLPIIGTDFDTFFKVDKLSFNDLSEILTKCMEEVGFLSDTVGSA
jgi:hypothetical protein